MNKLFELLAEEANWRPNNLFGHLPEGLSASDVCYTSTSVDFSFKVHVIKDGERYTILGFKDRVLVPNIKAFDKDIACARKTADLLVSQYDCGVNKSNADCIDKEMEEAIVYAKKLLDENFGDDRHWFDEVEQDLVDHDDIDEDDDEETYEAESEVETPEEKPASRGVSFAVYTDPKSQVLRKQSDLYGDPNLTRGISTGIKRLNGWSLISNVTTKTMMSGKNPVGVRIGLTFSNPEVTKNIADFLRGLNVNLGQNANSISMDLKELSKLVGTSKNAFATFQTSNNVNVGRIQVNNKKGSKK